MGQCLTNAGRHLCLGMDCHSLLPQDKLRVTIMLLSLSLADEVMSPVHHAQPSPTHVSVPFYLITNSSELKLFLLINYIIFLPIEMQIIKEWRRQAE